jgi:hypothetical protein
MAEQAEQVSITGLVDTKHQPRATKRRRYSEALERQMVAETKQFPLPPLCGGYRPRQLIRMGFRLTTIANDSGLMAKAIPSASCWSMANRLLMWS